MIRVFIADDHAVVRTGLRTMLASTSDLEFVGEAANGREVLDALETLDVDVLLLDLSLPRVGGIEVLRRLVRQRPRVRILVLSMYAEEQYAARMLREGATGYLSKDRPLEEVVVAIRRIAAGLSMPAARQPVRVSNAPHEQFSAREYQVFLLLLQGHMNADIAAELDLVPSTISNHTARIKEKLGAKSLAEVVSYAHRVGLID